MKIKVEYSESIQVSEGMWRKIGVEVDSENPVYTQADWDEVHNKAKDYVQRWHKEAQSSPATNPNWDHNQLSSKELPVIDRSIERLEILIDDCKTKEELEEVYRQQPMKIKKTGSLSNIYENKLEELSK